MKTVTSEDKSLLAELYGLNSSEIRDAEKLYHRSSMSICACGSNIMKKRKVKKQ